MYAPAVSTAQKRRPPRKKVQPVPLSGPGMKDLLASAGINAPQVVRSRTGNYVANIFVPGLNEPIEPADALTAKILKAFDGVKIVEVGETRADWRKDNPIVMVGITFTADQIKPKAQPVSGTSVIAAPSRSRGYMETCEPHRI